MYVAAADANSEGVHSEVSTAIPGFGARRSLRWLKDSLVCKPELKVKCELAFFIALVFIVWGLLSLPIVFYYMNQYQGANLNETITQISVTVNGTVDVGSGTHECLNTYTGSHCLSVLQKLTTCEAHAKERSDIHISTFIEDQNAIEEEIGTLFFALEAVVKPSDECRNELIPFVCLYKFGLCGENGTNYGPTAAECSNIRDSVCESEWKKATDLLEMHELPPLPDCSGFSDDGLKCDMVLNDTEACTIDCHNHFYCENNLCKPRCDNFKLYSDEYLILSDILIILSGCVGLLCGIVVMVIFLIRYKTMMIFPTILVFYSNISLISMDIIILIALMDRQALFCNSTDLLDSLEHSTPFCKLTGVVFIYVILQATLWWIFQICAIFWRVQFPFLSRHLDNTKRTRYLHATCAIIALVIPIIPPILTAVNGGFVMVRFPPIVCIGRETNVSFYSVILPITLLYAAGTTVLLAMLWKIRRHMSIAQDNSGRIRKSFHVSPAELKIVIVFLYYLVFGAVALTAFSVANKYIDEDADSITSYFNCQQLGYDSNCSLDIAQHPAWSSVALILLLLFPAINLVYAVRAGDVKRMCRACARFGRSVIPSKSTLETSYF